MGTQEQVMSLGKTYLIEHTTDTGVFRDMDKFDMSESDKFGLSIRLQFPKFSKGFAPRDFEAFIESQVGSENLAAIGRLAFPNEWQMRLTNHKIREKLIRMGRTKVNTRSCWISPLSQSEIRGYIHWLPNAISNDSIKTILEPFGEVLFIEISKNQKWDYVECDSRYFAVNLKPGRTMDDLPHFFKHEEHQGLITVRGRNPVCFHCRVVGHKKSECKKYREKLSEYCARKPNPGNIRRKRGRRHMPSLKAGAKQQGSGKKKKNSKGNASRASIPPGSTASETTNLNMPVAELTKNLGVMINVNDLNVLANCFQEIGLDVKKKIEVVVKKLSTLDPVVPSNVSGDTGETDPIEHNTVETEVNVKKSKSKKRKKKKSKAAKTPEASGESQEQQ